VEGESKRQGEKEMKRVRTKDPLGLKKRLGVRPSRKEKCRCSNWEEKRQGEPTDKKKGGHFEIPKGPNKESILALQYTYHAS